MHYECEICGEMYEDKPDYCNQSLACAIDQGESIYSMM